MLDERHDEVVQEAVTDIGRMKVIAVVRAYMFHLCASTLGILVSSGMLVFALIGPSRASSLLTEEPCFPVQTGLAFLAGAISMRRYRHVEMQWVWVVPFVIQVVAVAAMRTPILTGLQHYFTSECRPRDRCFDQLAVTLPFLTASAYSLGAVVSRRVLVENITARGD